MKNYLVNQALFYIVFFDEARRERAIDIDFQNILNGTSEIFCLTDAEKHEILSYFDNEDFVLMHNSDVIEFHLEFLKSIQCGDLFGCQEREKDALKTKLNAIDYYEKLQATDSDLISAFERNVEKKQVVFSFSLLHYLSYGYIPDRLIARLRKNISSKDACDFDSLILLLKVDESNMEQYKNILNKSSFKFYKRDYERIIQTRFKDKEVADGYSRKIS